MFTWDTPILQWLYDNKIMLDGFPIEFETDYGKAFDLLKWTLKVQLMPQKIYGPLSDAIIEEQQAIQAGQDISKRGAHQVVSFVDIMHGAPCSGCYTPLNAKQIC